MKSIALFFASLFIFSAGFGQAYIPFPTDSGATWSGRNLYEDFDASVSDDITFTTHDTSISGHVYTILKTRGNSWVGRAGDIPPQRNGSANSMDQTAGYIREDSKRVYSLIAFPGYKDTEELIYDFNLGIGDTATYALSPYYWQPSGSGIITAIDYVEISGVYHKRYKISGREPDLYIIEGIGIWYSKIGLNPYYFLYCFTYKGVTYQPDASIPCTTIYPFGTTAVANINAINNNIKIYPNPFSTTLKIDCGSPCTAIIYNSTGTRVINKQIAPGQPLTGLGEMSPGIYFIEVRNETGILLARQKITKL